MPGLHLRIAGEQRAITSEGKVFLKEKSSLAYLKIQGEMKARDLFLMCWFSLRFQQLNKSQAETFCSRNRMEGIYFRKLIFSELFQRRVKWKSLRKKSVFVQQKFICSFNFYALHLWAARMQRGRYFIIYVQTRKNKRFCVWPITHVLHKLNHQSKSA